MGKMDTIDFHWSKVKFIIVKYGNNLVNMIEIAPLSVF